MLVDGFVLMAEICTRWSLASNVASLHHCLCERMENAERSCFFPFFFCVKSEGCLCEIMEAVLFVDVAAPQVNCLLASVQLRIDLLLFEKDIKLLLSCITWLLVLFLSSL